MATGAGRMTEAMRSLEAAFLIGVDGVTEIWLVRHADCYQDMDDADDPPLSALGRKQAALLAARMRDLEPAAVYSSPYRRALETAQAIADDVSIDGRLIEMGMVVGEDGGFEFTELPESVVERMNAAISEIAQAHPGKRVVVVAHGGAITTFLAHVLRLEPGQLRFMPYFTSVNVVRFLGDRQMIATLGDTAHLE